MKKIVIKIILVIAILFLLSRVYYFVIISRAYDAILNFKNETNRYYSVTMINNGQNTIKEEIFIKDNIVKCNEKNDEAILHQEWKDFNNKQEYIIDFRNKTFKEKTLARNEQSFLKNLPRAILDSYQDDTFNLKQFLKIKYIIPVKYENQKCYKIVTNVGTVIINKHTYLPIYSTIKVTNSTEDTSTLTENRYEFKIDEVTNEDVALPDLTEFEDIIQK